MAKADIKSAFRLLPVHPGDFHLLGFSFDGFFFMDRALPLGCSISCSAVKHFSSFLEWVVRQCTGCVDSAHYLDDFLFVGPEGSTQCDRKLQGFVDLAAELGIPLVHEKTEGPTQVLTFLGVELDTIAQTSRLPLEKLLALRSMLAEFKLKRQASLKEFQQLIGHLNFSCKVVAPGRAFLGRLCDATIGLHMPHHRDRVTGEIRADLAVWETFLARFNGIQFWRDDLRIETELQVVSDASGSLGFGVMFRNHWCAEL